MGYEFMLLADPGPAREEVLRVLMQPGDARPDPDHEHRFWVRAAGAEYQVNIGTKDPIESIQVECPTSDLTLREAALRRSIALAEALDMRLEDVLWGDEVDAGNADRLIRSWQEPGDAAVATAKRPWWKVW